MIIEKTQLNVSTSGEVVQNIMIVCERVKPNVHGTPVYLLTTFSYSDNYETGYQWGPKIKGIRQRKDGRYRIEGYYKNEQEVVEIMRGNLQKYVDETFKQ